MDRRLTFVTVDVFTSRVLEGNPLAVFPDSGELSRDEMQAIAREFNLSETAFVQRRDRSIERADGFRTRIFTTNEELPFAGHPTLGTATVLREQGIVDTVVLELNVGRVPVRFSDVQGLRFGEMTQAEPTFGHVHDRGQVADAMDVSVEELDATLPIQTVSTGVPFAIVPFVRLEALQRWTPSWNRMHEYLRRTDAKYFYAVSRETVASDAQVHARMVFYGGEDPATGGAAGPAAAWLVRNKVVDSGYQIQIEQGLEASRPSRIFARAEWTGEKVTNVRVGGYCVPVLRGELRLP